MFSEPSFEGSLCSVTLSLSFTLHSLYDYLDYSLQLLQLSTLKTNLTAGS